MSPGQKAVSEFDVNNTKAWIHNSLYKLFSVNSIMMWEIFSWKTLVPTKHCKKVTACLSIVNVEITLHVTKIKLSQQ